MPPKVGVDGSKVWPRKKVCPWIKATGLYTDLDTVMRAQAVNGETITIEAANGDVWYLSGAKYTTEESNIDAVEGTYDLVYYGDKMEGRKGQ